MADEADRCDPQIEANITDAIHRRKPEGPAATGKCLSCNAGLPRGMRWCDALCREDWELDEALKERASQQQRKGE